MEKLNCVLIIDDDKVSNYVTEKTIRSMGMATMINITMDGEQALNYMKHQCVSEDDYACPDLILLDINMPHLNGFEFLEKFAKLKVHKKSRIIILSTAEVPEDKKMLVKNFNVVDFIEKPLTADKVINFIHGHFPVLRTGNALS